MLIKYIPKQTNQATIRKYIYYYYEHNLLITKQH